VEFISKAWKEVPISIIPNRSDCAVCLIWKMKHKMTIFEMTEQSGEGASSSQNESVTDGSSNKLSD
jgi:hypothetical protein